MIFIAAFAKLINQSAQLHSLDRFKWPSTKSYISSIIVLQMQLHAMSNNDGNPAY